MAKAFEFNSETHFQEIHQQTIFRRIFGHPLRLYYGLNETNRIALRYVGNFEKKAIKSSEWITVDQFLLADGSMCLEFSLSSEKNEEIFFAFCDDVVKMSSDLSDPNNGYSYLVSRYSIWQKFFTGKRKLLSEEKIMGLIGELYFLKEFLIPMYGNEAIRAWGGAEPTSKDFSIGETWYEAKACGLKKNTIHISSLAQLESPLTGHLVVIKLEPMNEPYFGTTLNGLTRAIRELVAEDFSLLTDFETKLLQAKYIDVDEYDAYVYQVHSVDRYKVDRNFPVIRKADLNEAIGDVSYTLLLPNIADFLEVD